MKKLFIILFVSALMAFGAAHSFAQSFNGGLILGGNFSQVDGDSYFGYHQLGLTGGGYVNLPMSERFSFQMELKYTQLGAHSDAKEVEWGYKPFNLRLHYAELPLMLQYHCGYFKINGFSLNFLTLEAGVSLDFLLKSTEDVDTDLQETTTRWRFFSATGNLGARFNIGKHWGVGVRWMYSILPIRFNGASPSFFYGHYYNKVWMATVTYNIKAPKQ